MNMRPLTRWRCTRLLGYPLSEQRNAKQEAKRAQTIHQIHPPWQEIPHTSHFKTYYPICAKWPNPYNVKWLMHSHFLVLVDQIDLMSVRGLDHNLFAGAEVKEVYKELSKSISAEYFQFVEVRLFTFNKFVARTFVSMCIMFLYFLYEDFTIDPAPKNTKFMPGLKKNLDKKLINSSLQMLYPSSLHHRWLSPKCLATHDYITLSR